MARVLPARRARCTLALHGAGALVGWDAALVHGTVHDAHLLAAPRADEDQLERVLRHIDVDHIAAPGQTSLDKLVGERSATIEPLLPM